MNKEEMNCVYSTNGITTMSTKQYDNYINIIHDLKKENQQLKKNRDKAIERCEFWLDFYRNVNNDERIILRLNDILSKLKGDYDG